MGKINIPGNLPIKGSLEKALDKGTEVVKISTETLQKLVDCVILLTETVKKLDARLDELNESILIHTKETISLKDKIELHREAINESIQTMEKQT